MQNIEDTLNLFDLFINHYWLYLCTACLVYIYLQMELSLIFKACICALLLIPRPFPCTPENNYCGNKKGCIIIPAPPTNLHTSMKGDYNQYVVGKVCLQQCCQSH